MVLISFINHNNELRKNPPKDTIWNNIELGNVVVIKGLGTTGVVNSLNEFSGTLNIITTTTNGMVSMMFDINPNVLIKVQDLENK